MKKIKLVFETEIEGQTKKFGYIVNQGDQSYITCQFDDNYEASEISEIKPVGDQIEFGKKLARLIKIALKNG